jgi:hypothetical protein
VCLLVPTSRRAAKPACAGEWASRCWAALHAELQRDMEQQSGPRLYFLRGFHGAGSGFLWHFRARSYSVRTVGAAETSGGWGEGMGGAGPASHFLTRFVASHFVGLQKTLLLTGYGLSWVSFGVPSVFLL